MIIIFLWLRVNQHLIDLNLYSVSIINISVSTYYCESSTESKFDVKFVNTVKSTTYQVRIFKINQIFGTKHSKTNWLQKIIKCKTNE